MIKFFDLFSGAGGFRLAFENAGFQCVGHCEIDKHANKLYTNYFDTSKEKYFNDATTINTEDIPDFDILCAGFPCQSFSIAGQHGGFDDKRGQLFYEVIRILSDKKPKCFVLENVKNLLSHDCGRTFQTILKSLADLGYILQWQVINSKSYLPQNRERIFIVGFLGAKCFRQIFPAEIQERPTYCKINANINQKGVVLSNRDECLITDTANTIDANYQKGIGNQPRTAVLVGTLRTHNDGKGFREIKDGICPAIPARAREDGSGQPVISDGARIRRLTPLECFRLQGFPDEIVQKAYEVGISDAQLYKMAGNTVTVPVVYDIAQRIYKKMELVYGMGNSDYSRCFFTFSNWRFCNGLYRQKENC